MSIEASWYPMKKVSLSGSSGFAALNQDCARIPKLDVMMKFYDS